MGTLGNQPNRTAPTHPLRLMEAARYELRQLGEDPTLDQTLRYAEMLHRHEELALLQQDRDYKDEQVGALAELIEILKIYLGEPRC